MKNIKRALALVLCMVMVLTYLPMNVLAAGGEPNVTISVDKTEVEVGDTITVKLGITEMNASSLALGFDFDKTLLEVSSITAKRSAKVPYYDYDPDAEEWFEDELGCTTVSTKDEANNSGHIGVVFANDHEVLYYEKEAILTIKFLVLASGTVEFEMFEDSAGTDGCKVEWTSDKTVTIKGSESEHVCAAGAVSYKASSEDGKHIKIVACADNCGKNFSETVEACSGGSPTCQVSAICDNCGNYYGEKVDHQIDESQTVYQNYGDEGHYVYTYCVYWHIFSGELVPHDTTTHNCICGYETGCADTNNDHNCDTCGENLTDCSDKDGDGDHYCDVCGKADVTDHKGGSATCQEPATCTECGSKYGEENSNNHTGGEYTIYTPNQNHPDYHYEDTHCKGCEKRTDRKRVEHNYAKDTHKCVCGDIEKFTLTVVDMTGFSYTFSVEYGTNVLEFLSETGVNTEERYINDSTWKIGTETFVNWEDAYTGSVDEDTLMTGDMSLAPFVRFVGWYSDNDGGNWYYNDGFGYVLGWQKIDGAWYYFDTETAYRVTGTVRVGYPILPIEGVTYTYNQEDKNYAAGNEDSKYTDATSALFIFGDDGVFQNTYTGITAGSYAVNGMIAWHPGLVEIDGEYYYFVGDADKGNTLAQGDVYVSRLNGIEGFDKGAVYNFENGRLSGLNGLVDRFGDGKLYYYENSKLMLANGLTKFEDGYIYVRSNGQMVVGEQYWVAKTNGFCEPGLYTFGEDGFMQAAQDPSVNGLVDGVYYKNGMPYYAGLIEIDGDIYYVKTDGSVATGTYYITKTNGMAGFEKGQKLTFGADGKLVEG